MIGIISAFGASISWTYACFIWRSQTKKYKSLDINFVKNIIAFLIFLPTFFTFNYSNNLKSSIILFFSGIIGIGLGDTFYIKSLQLIGTRKTLSIETISPILAALSGEIFINETLSIKSWIGILVISICLFAILSMKSNIDIKNSSKNIKKNNREIYIYPFLSVLCAVTGALLSRMAFIDSHLSPLFTTEIRLLGAIIFLVTIKKFQINFFLSELDKNEQNKFIFSIILGTNIGILLQQIVFKTLPIGIGWAILSTSPVISLLFAKQEEGKIEKKIILFTGLLFIGLCIIIF